MATQAVRGAEPSSYARYSSGGDAFACFDGSGTIPIAQLNDEFCDCADGSDEPLTGACPDTTFACALPRGPQQATVPSSRVNDGVCDCCDGSDEWSLVEVAVARGDLRLLATTFLLFWFLQFSMKIAFPDLRI